MNKTLINKNLRIRQESTLAVILIFSYCLYLLAPPWLIPSDTRWYAHLAVCIIVYMLYGKAIDINASKLYWVFAFLYLSGAILSLLRVSDITSGMYLIIGSAISFLTYFILTPSLSSQRVRAWLLVALILAAIGWTIHVQSQMADLRYLLTPYYLKGPGNDKNFIAFILSLAITIVFATFVVWDNPVRGLSKKLIKVGLLALGLYFLYYVFLTYSRSGLVATFSGLLGVLALYLKKRGLGIGPIVVLTIVGFSGYYFLIAQLPQLAPQWVGYFDEDRLGMRVTDIQKAVAIISENPIIGIGIDQTKNSYSVFGQIESFERGLPHNLYLKAWAEVGLLGIIGFGSWIFFFLKKIRYDFPNLSMVDQIWMMAFIPLFTMLAFLDLSTIAYLLLALMAGIFYLKPDKVGA